MIYPDKTFYANLYRTAKKNASTRGIQFDLSKSDYADIVNVSDGKCGLTGIDFVLDKHESHGRAPYAPSLDRIDGQKGYSRDNCRLVCVAVNFAMNEWGENVFKYVAFRMLKKLSPYDFGKLYEYKYAGRRKKVFNPFAGIKIRPGMDGPSYQARFSGNGKTVYLGTFSSPEFAAARIAEEYEKSLLAGDGQN